MFAVACVHKKWTLMKIDVKAAFLQGDVAGEHATSDGEERKAQGEIEESERHLVCEPVPELCNTLGLEHWQVIRLVKSAYGLIDAPHAWWNRLTGDVERLGWRGLVSVSHV